MHDWTIRWMSRPVLGITGGLGLLGLAGGLLLACAPREGGWSFPEAEAWRRVSMRSRRTALAVADLPPSPAGARDAPQADSDADPVALGLFARNCATCHGVDGSGQGPSVLDRPARNFKDGGFSFGNTADAIFNTISFGIPGTPMPAFELALAEEERWQLADFVRTLGPPVEDVDVADTIMTVTDTPLIVRGILPPIVEGAPIRPRGLLIGLPGDEGAGLTFEYRIDDVRLLGVRQGGFVARTDWNDRGGTPLKPLGGLIWVDGAGDPPFDFRFDLLGETRRRLVRTLGHALSSELVGRDGERAASVEEWVEPCERGELTGFTHSFLVEDYSWRVHSSKLTVRIAIPAPADRIDAFGSAVDPEAPQAEGGGTQWRIFRRSNGVHECVGVQLSSRPPSRLPTLSESEGRLEAIIWTPENSPNFGRPGDRVVVHRVFTNQWSEATRAKLLGTQP